MKKSLLFIALAFLMTFGSSAQVAEGTLLTEDVVFTDLDGTEHSLFSYLDEGKTVVLDMFAEWCGPCWNYHNTGTSHPNGGALKALYNAHGPDGTDEVVVFAVETDPSTDVSLMYGGAGTQGWDWVSETPYPMADANIGGIFEQGYYPYIVRICPNRQIFELGQQSVAGIMNDVGECLSAEGEVNPAILSYDGETATCGEIEVPITFQNLGSTTLTSATFDVMVDGVSENTFEWTGSLETFEVASVTVHETTLSADATVMVDITSTDEFEVSSSLEQDIDFAAETANIVILSLTLDSYPTETSWEFRNEAGTAIASGGPYSGGDALTTITEEITVPALGCYSFKILDSYGDGLNAAAFGGTNGSYTIEDYNGVEIGAGGGNDQWTEETSPFLAIADILSVANNSIDGEVKVFPNPTSDILNVNISLFSTQRLTYEIIDVTGRIVDGRDLGQLSVGEKNFTTDLSDYEAGIYLLSINSGNSKTIKRILVSK